MALQDKLRRKAEPFMEPGEQVQVAFSGQTGPHPMTFMFFGALGAIIGMAAFRVKFVMFVVTDLGVTVLNLNWLGKPTEVLERYDRDLAIPLTRGVLYGKAVIDGQRYWVHRRLLGAAEEAAATLAGVPHQRPAETGRIASRAER